MYGFHVWVSCTTLLEVFLKVKHEICFSEIYILFTMVGDGLPYDDL